MTDDLIKRLRDEGHLWRSNRTEAADRIEAQEAEIARLREALGWYANKNRWHTNTLYMCGHSGPSDAEHDRGNRAHQALQETANDPA